MNQVNESQVMTPLEVCRYLKISRKTLYRLLKKGALPGFKVGGAWRFRRQDVDNYILHTIVIPGRFFAPTLLNKYYSQPQKYEISRRGESYWLKVKSEWLAKLPKAQRVAERFPPIKFRRVRWPDGRVVLMMNSKNLARLPKEELPYWLTLEVFGIR